MQIKKIDYTPEFVYDFGETNECEKYAIIIDDIIVGVIFKIDNEIGFYMNELYRKKGYMYKALNCFIKPNYTFTVCKNNVESNNLLEKLNIKKYKEDNFFNYYKY